MGSSFVPAASTGTNGGALSTPIDCDEDIKPVIHDLPTVVQAAAGNMENNQDALNQVSIRWTFPCSSGM